MCAIQIQCVAQTHKSPIDKNYVKNVLGNMYTAEYIKFKQSIINEFSGLQPGNFGEFVKGVNTSFETNQKQIAFTFDACIGHKDDYNKALVDLLIKEKIPATFFVSGSWIDYNTDIVKELSANELFEIENHGLFHRICSINGRSMYDIEPTNNIGEVVDEMELNAIKIEKTIGKRPRFFRSSTAYIDEASVKIAERLGMRVVNFDILSGDAIAKTPAKILKDNILKNAHQGAIVIMHFNHPQWHEKDALEMIISVLRSEGYSFVKLNEVKLLNKK